MRKPIDRAPQPHSVSARVEALTVRALRRRDEQAARQLGRLGVRGVRALVDALPRRPHVASLMLHAALGQMQKDGTLSALRDLATPEAPFVALLTDPLAIVRSVTIRLLGHSGDQRWVPRLCNALKDDADPFVRSNAADALGNLDAVDAMPLLAEVVENQGDPARYHALRALGQFGVAAWTHLTRVAVLHPEEAVRRVAAETVARAGDTPAWKALLRSLDEDATSDEVRKTLVEGLGRSRMARAAVPLVRRLVDDSSPAVREAAADALATLRETRTVGALFDSALYDPHSVPASGACRTTVGDSPDSPGDRHYPVREAAAKALRVLGGTQAWEELAAPVDDLTALPALASRQR
jgi:HEAT repeat protein